MRKLLQQSMMTGLISLSLIGCSTTGNSNIETSNSTNFKQKELFHASLEQSIPMLLFIPSFQSAQIAYSMPGLYLEKPINPFDPSFAQCMDTAIKSNAYRSSLKLTLDDYFSTVNEEAYQQDLNLLTSNEYRKEITKFANLFELFSKNKTLKENQDIFYPRFENSENKKLTLTQSQFLSKVFNINQETPLNNYITTQMSECFEVQKLY